MAEALTAILREDGIDVLLQTETTHVERNVAGKIMLSIESAEGKRQLHASHLLVATGRTPNTEDLNLAAAGIRTDDKGYIEANERLETGVAGIYALGDVKGGPAFTHISYDDYRIVSTNLLEGGQRTTHDRLVPYTIFTDPQLGRIGLSEKEARQTGRAVRVATMPMSSVARANEVGESRGMMKALVDEASAVSYTHLDVYKRQSILFSPGLFSPVSSVFRLFAPSTAALGFLLRKAGCEFLRIT